MIKIKISEDELPGDPLDESWVHEQVNYYRLKAA